MFEETLVSRRRAFNWRWAARKVLAALGALFTAVGIGTTISALAGRETTWMTPPSVDMFTFANGRQSVLEETGIIRNNLATLRDVEAGAVAADERLENRVQVLEGTFTMLTRATARCERGFAFDTTSGRCTAAPCDVPGSNGNSGPSCACPFGSGNVTWSGDAWVGACVDPSIPGITLGHLSGPPLTEQWQLALNVDTDDGNHVDYYNNNFWQSATRLGGATADKAHRFTHDFKDTDVFTMSGVKQILVVVHNEGALLGWRRWRTIDSQFSLHHHFNAGNTCPGSLAPAGSVHVARETIDAEEGSLSLREPLVMNKEGVSGPTTHTDLFINECGHGSMDCNRLTTGISTNRDVGWGLGTAYHASSTCGDAGFIRADAELHDTHGVAVYPDGAWWHGLIGSDCIDSYCVNGSSSWIGGSSGLSYDYAIFVAV